jgi:uncharacterized RDD family membrane protein YckC
MTEGTPDQPAPPATPEPTPPAAPTDPTTVTPAPPAQPGLISAAPVGWSAPPPAAGPVGWGAPAEPPPAGTPQPPVSTGATVGWAPPPPPREVAPGLAFADTVSRFIAYLVDLILIGIVAGTIASIVGIGEATSTISSGRFDYAYRVSGAAFTVPIVVLSLAYFVFCWSGGRRATIGQRIFGIQVGNAFDGQPLSIEQAVKRWVGLGLFLSVFELVLPPNQTWLGGVQLLWSLALLVSTSVSPTKQGLHDKFANSALVRPAGAGSRGLAMACAVIIGLILVFFIIGIVGLIFLGGQVIDILSRVGDSI